MRLFIGSVWCRLTGHNIHRHSPRVILLDIITHPKQTALCALNRHQGRQTSVANRVASFVSAASYAIYPNRTLLAHAIVSAGRIGWTRTVEELGPNSVLLQRLDALPWAPLLHMFGVGMIYHVRIVYPYWSPAFLKKTTSLLSGGS